MFEQFITPINYPELIKMQAMANCTTISPESINNLRASEKTKLNNSYEKVVSKRFPKRYSAYRNR